MNNFRIVITFCVVALLSLTLNACSTQTVKTTTYTPVVYEQGSIAEDELLDVGIAIFDPGLDQIDQDEAELTFSDVRIAESYYTAHLLAQTLQTSGNWGVVRIIPHDLSSTDLAVIGTIVQADGETMRVHIKATDSTGNLWLDKEYEEIVSRYSYDPRLRREEDAFQGLYNKIANDLLYYRQKNLNREALLTIRTVSQIQFASDFAPEVYADYLQENRRGILEVKRLPASNDPIMTRVDAIRERDYLYVDTLQDYYAGFALQMKEPYNEFRKMSYDEVIKLDQLQRDARRNMVLGILAIVGGLAATQSDNSAADWAVYGGLAAGGYLIKDAFNTRSEAQMHVESIAELGHSLEREIAPQTIELEERSVTLSGSVESQYQQWREILAEIYANETGG